jgi:hypothetical protein
MAKFFFYVTNVLTPQDWGSFAWGATVSFIVCFVVFCALLFIMSAGRSGEQIDRVFEENLKKEVAERETEKSDGSNRETVWTDPQGKLKPYQAV